MPFSFSVWWASVTVYKFILQLNLKRKNKIRPRFLKRYRSFQTLMLSTVFCAPLSIVPALTDQITSTRPPHWSDLLEGTERLPAAVKPTLKSISNTDTFTWGVLFGEEREISSFLFASHLSFLFLQTHTVFDSILSLNFLLGSVFKIEWPINKWS